MGKESISVYNSSPEVQTNIASLTVPVSVPVAAQTSARTESVTEHSSDIPVSQTAGTASADAATTSDIKATASSDGCLVLRPTSGDPGSNPRASGFNRGPDQPLSALSSPSVFSLPMQGKSNYAPRTVPSSTPHNDSYAGLKKGRVRPLSTGVRVRFVGMDSSGCRVGLPSNRPRYESVSLSCDTAVAHTAENVIVNGGINLTECGERRNNFGPGICPSPKPGLSANLRAASIDNRSAKRTTTGTASPQPAYIVCSEISTDQAIKFFESSRNGDICING